MGSSGIDTDPALVAKIKADAAESAEDMMDADAERSGKPTGESDEDEEYEFHDSGVPSSSKRRRLTVSESEGRKLAWEVGRGWRQRSG